MTHTISDTQRKEMEDILQQIISANEMIVQNSQKSTKKFTSLDDRLARIKKMTEATGSF